METKVKVCCFDISEEKFVEREFVSSLTEHQLLSIGWSKTKADALKKAVEGLAKSNNKNLDKLKTILDNIKHNKEKLERINKIKV